MYIFRVCVSAVWSAAPVQVNLGLLLERVAALYSFFFLWRCSSGYGTVETVKGVVRFLASFSLLVAFLAVGCLR
jgi:hypothetical protein